MAETPPGRCAHPDTPAGHVDGPDSPPCNRTAEELPDDATPADVPQWYLASVLRAVARVIGQNPAISDAELAALWAAYHAPGVTP